MATALHRLKAWLYPNLLTKEDPNDYVARVESERSLSVDDICESAVTRGGADIPAASMAHAVNLFLKEMAYRLCDGFAVNTGWLTGAASIRGNFKKGETYDPAKHTVLFEFHQGSLLRKELENVSVEILGVADSGAVIDRVVDAKTGSVNDVLTPNRNLKIFGQKIRIAGDKTEEIGVYFISLGTADPQKVDDSDIVVNNPSELIVVIPQLSAGPWQLQVVTQFTTGSPLKEPRTALFDKTLTVTA
ncbi:MAG: DUF4469 domain-containing protein [Tannerella sp.]|jgi:hypothetical protein|nr:DUF4469 domain-containing protein [Tannerella sp.]